jgi:hypothetical protein
LEVDVADVRRHLLGKGMVVEVIVVDAGVCMEYARRWNVRCSWTLVEDGQGEEEHVAYIGKAAMDVLLYHLVAEAV